MRNKLMSLYKTNPLLRGLVIFTDVSLTTIVLFIPCIALKLPTLATAAITGIPAGFLLFAHIKFSENLRESRNNEDL